jgi:hypothetical protein
MAFIALVFFCFVSSATEQALPLADFVSQVC